MTHTAIRFVQAKLDEVVATAEGAHLIPDALVVELADAIHDGERVVAIVQLITLALQRDPEQAVVMRADRLVVRGESNRHARFDGRANLAE